jgi:homoserine O-acetyltransferase
MAEPAPALAAGPAGSAGTVETQYLDLPGPVRLDCGRELYPIRVAYETYGVLSPRRDNVILVCHALSGDAHAAGFAKAPPESSTRDGFAAEDRDGAAGKALGWWDGMIGPGKAFDTDRYFVISTNLLGGCRGTTGPSSPDPTTGTPYGLNFPVITVADMVRTERAFLDELGIERLAAVAGGSLGGMQAFEWAIRSLTRWMPSSPSPAHTLFTPKASPGMRSPARRSCAIPRGGAGTITAQARIRAPGWVSRE